MNRVLRFVLFFLVGYFIGYVGVRLAFGEVNIAEVEGKYEEPDRADLVKWMTTHSIKLNLEALNFAYRAGYIQCLHDYEIEESSTSYKQKNER